MAMRAVVAFSHKQRVFYNLTFVVLMVAGFISLFGLPVERYPNFGSGQVIISTVYPGASPVEVESLVTRKIEEALEPVDDVEWINATSFNGCSHIRLKFIDDSDYDALFNEVRFEVRNIIHELPEGGGPLQLVNARVQDWLPVISINLACDHSNRAHHYEQVHDDYPGATVTFGGEHKDTSDLSAQLSNTITDVDQGIKKFHFAN
jgi:multidrug efflux pump subunit AcrB